MNTNTNTQTNVQFETVTKTKVKLGNAPVTVTIQPLSLLRKFAFLALALAFGWTAIDWLLQPATEVVYGLQAIFGYLIIHFGFRKTIVNLVLQAKPADQQSPNPQ